MIAIIHWTPNEFIYAVTATWCLCLVMSGMIIATSEWFERRLVQAYEAIKSKFVKSAIDS